MTFSTQTIEWKEQCNLFNLSEESERILGSLTSCNYMLLHLDESTEQSAMSGERERPALLYECMLHYKKYAGYLLAASFLVENNTIRSSLLLTDLYELAFVCLCSTLCPPRSQKSL